VPDASPSGADASSSDADASSPAPSCPETYFSSEIPVPATSTVFAYKVERFSAQIAAGQGDVSLSITDNHGTVAFDGKGPMPALIFATQPYPAVSRTLYAGLGIADGAWYPFWLYCDADGRLTRFFGEMTDQDRDFAVNLDGTCAPTGESFDLTIDVPAHSLRHVALTCGFSVSSPPGPSAIDLGDSRAGSMDFAGNSATVLPFHTIDCRSGCGSQSWVEIHSIVWDPIRQDVGFTIFYLFVGQSGVSTGNGIMLPLATTMAQSLPNAMWTLER
jgi:hypothetical protein